MSGDINVISRTQLIIVEPISGTVSVTNAGPTGPTGATGSSLFPSITRASLNTTASQGGLPPGKGYLIIGETPNVLAIATSGTTYLNFPATSTGP